MRWPWQKVEAIAVLNIVPKFAITESRAGTWHYHISHGDNRMEALCGVKTMPCQMPLHYYGCAFDRKEFTAVPKWCLSCVELKAALELGKAKR